MSTPALLGWTPSQWVAVMKSIGQPAPDLHTAIKLRRIWCAHNMPLDVETDDCIDAVAELFIEAEKESEAISQPTKGSNHDQQ